MARMGIRLEGIESPYDKLGVLKQPLQGIRLEGIESLNKGA